MKTSQQGINLIKKYEGCRLTAYKPVAAEKYYTIGYGHYGADVYSTMIITQKQAEAYLVQDLVKFENAVNKTGLMLTQNQFDALVSFTYNCGAGNLKKLIKGRTLPQIADALLLYNKGSGKVLAGLTKRRKEERELFLSGSTVSNIEYPTLKMGSMNSFVTIVQKAVGADPDGIFGNETYKKVCLFQKQNGLVVDGIVGPKTWAAINNK